MMMKELVVRRDRKPTNEARDRTLLCVLKKAFVMFVNGGTPYPIDFPPVLPSLPLSIHAW